MSFILDALKKAESERSRASGPVLVDVRIAPPRRRLPAWAWVLGAVLVANLAVLSWLVLRSSPAPVIAAAPATPAALPPGSEPAGVQRVPAAALPAATLPVAPYVPPHATPEPTLPAADALPVNPPAVAMPPPAARPAPRTGNALPTARQLQAMGVSLPPLLLNLHVYDPSPELRYVLLNGLRLTQGEFTPDGIKVDTITEQGVVLEARGQRFLLPAGAE